MGLLRHILAIMACATILAACASVRAADPEPTQPPAGYAPTLEDGRRAAVEEIKLLPGDALQVDCAVGIETFPPYTNPSGGLSAIRFFILSDGRCFEAKGPDPRTLIIELPAQ